MNNVVNKLPFRMWRHRVYQLLGVKFEAPETGCLMMGVEIHQARKLRVGRNSVVGPAGPAGRSSAASISAPT